MCMLLDKIDMDADSVHIVLLSKWNLQIAMMQECRQLTKRFQLN